MSDSDRPRWRSDHMRITIENNSAEDPVMFSRIFWPLLLFLALLAPGQAAVDLVTLPTQRSR